MRYLINNLDGSVAIMTMADGHEDVDPAALIAQWHDSRKSQVVGFRQLADDEMPADRAFRNAWVDNGGKISVHMEKAKEIVNQKLRIEMADHIKEQDLLSKMGRDLDPINQKIKGLAAKVAQLDQLAVSGFDDQSALDSLKSLVTTTS